MDKLQVIFALKCKKWKETSTKKYNEYIDERNVSKYTAKVINPKGK